MIPCNTSISLFEKYQKTQIIIGKYKGIILKRKGLAINEIQVKLFRAALKDLINFYKPHCITKKTYHRWSFSIPIELDGDHYTGINLIVEWHKDTARMLEYLVIDIKRKSWELNHLPPCLWE